MSPTNKQGYIHLGGDDDEEIKVIPIKKSTEDCCDKEQLKTIKIVWDCSSDLVRDPLLYNICSVPMMSQAFTDRHMKLSVTGICNRKIDGKL